MSGASDAESFDRCGMRLDDIDTRVQLRSSSPSPAPRLRARRWAPNGSGVLDFGHLMRTRLDSHADVMYMW